MTRTNGGVRKKYLDSRNTSKVELAGFVDKQGIRKSKRNESKMTV